MTDKLVIIAGRLKLPQLMIIITRTQIHCLLPSDDGPLSKEQNET